MSGSTALPLAALLAALAACGGPRGVAPPCEPGQRAAHCERPDTSCPVGFHSVSEGCAAWVSMPQMSVGRTAHTATLVTGDLVLVAGGSAGGPHPYKSAELFDPGTRTWQPLPDMTHPRSVHTATLLSDGRVLLAGGYQRASQQWQASAEIFDPMGRTFSATADMSQARALHGASRLGDGRVLVSGGRAELTFLDSAEIWDPRTGRWLEAPKMADARGSHASIGLADGRVLVAGGVRPGGPLAAAELFDPKANAWSSAGAMATPGWECSGLALADGRALVAGCVTREAGSIADATVLAEVALYDPREGWSAAPALPIPLADVELVQLPSGDVVVVGGSGRDWAPEATSFRWRPGDAQWRPWVPLGEPLRHHRAVALSDGRVLLVGGRRDGALTAPAQAFTLLLTTLRSPAP